MVAHFMATSSYTPSGVLCEIQELGEGGSDDFYSENKSISFLSIGLVNV